MSAAAISPLSHDQMLRFERRSIRLDRTETLDPNTNLDGGHYESNGAAHARGVPQKLAPHPFIQSYLLKREGLSLIGRQFLGERLVCHVPASAKPSPEPSYSAV